MHGAATLAPPNGGGPAVDVVPFVYGSNHYSEKFHTGTHTLTTAQIDITESIPPGGFLRGVRVMVSATTGVLGGGTLSADAPGSVFASMSIENVDGAPIIHPASGWSHMWRQFLSRPWQGDPTLKTDYAASVNPSFSLFLQTEVRHTAGVLENTDSRSQYKFKATLATLAQYVSGGAPTAPAVTVVLFLETWAQPDREDLAGNPIQARPDGLALAAISRKGGDNLVAAGSDNHIQLNLTGNEIRLLMLVTRLSTGVRSDLLSDPIRWRLDERSMGTYSPAQLRARAEEFYRSFGPLSAIPAGVYPFPRFFNPGALVGQNWLKTNNASFCVWESATAAGGTSGTWEVFTDEVAPRGMVPLELEGI